jgi:hypothetical protein
VLAVNTKRWLLSVRWPRGNLLRSSLQVGLPTHRIPRGHSRFDSHIPRYVHHTQALFTDLLFLISSAMPWGLSRTWGGAGPTRRTLGVNITMWWVGGASFFATFFSTVYNIRHNQARRVRGVFFGATRPGCLCMVLDSDKALPFTLNKSV